MNISDKIKSGTLWIGIRFVFSGLLTMVTMPLIARTLSVEAYGIYNILFALLSWISLFTGFGLPQMLQRFIPETLQNEDFATLKVLVINVVLARLILSLCAILIVHMNAESLAALLKIDGWKTYFLYFSVGIVCSLEAKILETVLNGLLLQKYAVIASIVWSVSRISLLGVVILLDLGLAGILWMETIAWLIWLGMLCFFCTKHLAGKKGKHAVDIQYKRLFRYSGFSFFSEVGVSILDMTTDLLIISAFLGPVAAGLYGFCDRIIKLLQRVMPHAVLRELIRPLFFIRYTKSGDPGELNKMFGFLIRLSAFFLFPVSVTICVLGQEFITHVFGEKYLAAYVPLCIFAVLIAANAFSDPASYILKALEKVNILFYSKIFAIYNLIGDLVVVRHWGISGVALVTASALLFKNLFCLYFARQYTGLKLDFSGITAISLNSVMAGITLLCLKSYISGIASLLASVAAGSIVYACASTVNKVFTWEENQMINRFLPVKLFWF